MAEKLIASIFDPPKAMRQRMELAEKAKRAAAV
jgi:hypothetical protein